MKTKQFRCQHCRKICTARVANQKYCNKRECQQARKSSWGKEKYACDPDYRANQRVSTQAWLLPPVKPGSTFTGKEIHLVGDLDGIMGSTSGSIIRERECGRDR